jgi:hypothetical protein
LIRLLHKYASALNGFDLSCIAVGDVVVVTGPTAAMLAREGWAEAVTDRADESQRDEASPIPKKPRRRRLL